MDIHRGFQQLPHYLLMTTQRCIRVISMIVLCIDIRLDLQQPLHYIHLGLQQLLHHLRTTAPRCTMQDCLSTVTQHINVRLGLRQCENHLLVSPFCRFYQWSRPVVISRLFISNINPLGFCITIHTILYYPLRKAKPDEWQNRKRVQSTTLHAIIWINIQLDNCDADKSHILACIHLSFCINSCCWQCGAFLW